MKPDNILFTKHRVVKLADLGLVFDRADDVRITAESMAVGSPCYVSPEACMTPLDVDHRADLYSLGVTAFECLAGRVPFDGPSSASIIIKQIRSRSRTSPRFAPASRRRRSRSSRSSRRRSATSATRPQPISCATPAALALADADGDGKADFLAIERAGAAAVLHVYRSKGDGTFEPIGHWKLGGIEDVRLLAAADLDGDGKTSCSSTGKAGWGSSTATGAAVSRAAESAKRSRPEKKGDRP